MNRPFGTILVVAGIVLIVAGYHASQSMSSDVSRFFTGTATDKALWMMVAGIASSLAGVVIVSRGNVN